MELMIGRESCGEMACDGVMFKLGGKKTVPTFSKKDAECVVKCKLCDALPRASGTYGHQR